MKKMRNSILGWKVTRRLTRVTNSLFLAVCIAIATLLLFAHAAQAQVRTYTLSGVTFTDGGTASGYFDYNSSTELFSGYDITTTNGFMDGLTGTTYSGSSAAGAPGNVVFYGPGSSELNLAFVPYLTSSTSFGLVPGAITGPGSTMGSGEFTKGTIATYRPVGTVTVVSTPEMSPLAILSLALIATLVTATTFRRKSSIAA